MNFLVDIVQPKTFFCAKRPFCPVFNSTTKYLVLCQTSFLPGLNITFCPLYHGPILPKVVPYCHLPPLYLHRVGCIDLFCAKHPFFLDLILLLIVLFLQKPCLIVLLPPIIFKADNISPLCAKYPSCSIVNRTCHASLPCLVLNATIQANFSLVLPFIVIYAKTCLILNGPSLQNLHPKSTVVYAIFTIQKLEALNAHVCN